MGTLIEIVYNKMTIEQLKEMNEKGVSLIINDGLIVGVNNEKAPTNQGFVSQQGVKGKMKFAFLCNCNIEERKKQ